MSDVLHHTLPSVTAAAIINRHNDFLAKINETAEARKLPPAPVIVRDYMTEAFGPIVIFKKVIPSIENIKRLVAEHFQTSVTNLISDRRDAETVYPRQIAFYLCKTLTTHSLVKIGKKFNNRDHTTVLHGVRRVHGRLCTGDLRCIEAVDQLTERLGGVR